MLPKLEFLYSSYLRSFVPVPVSLFLFSSIPLSLFSLPLLLLIMNSNDPINDLTYLTEKLECTDHSEHQKEAFKEEHTIIAKVLSSKPINMNVFKNTMTKAWNPKGKTLTNQLQQNTMAFIFESKEDFHKILNSSWSIRESQIIIQHWPSDLSFSEINLSKTNIWIHPSNLPANLNLQTTKNIGNTIGRFIKTDLLTTSHKWRKSLRIQVEIDINKPLTDLIQIPREKRPDLKTEIRYERIVDYCFFCGLLGHKLLNCKPMSYEGISKIPNPPSILLTSQTLLNRTIPPMKFL